MADQKKPPIDTEFFAIANTMVADEANEYLNKRLKLMEKWIAYQEAHGERADLRALIDQLGLENTARGPTIVCLAAALWRIRELEKQHEQ